MSAEYTTRMDRIVSGCDGGKTAFVKRNKNQNSGCSILMRGAGSLHSRAGGLVRAQAMTKKLKTNLFITDGSISRCLDRKLR